MDMKRFILSFFFFMCFCTAAIAEDEIYLQQYNKSLSPCTKQLPSIKSYDLNNESDFHISPQNAYDYMNKNPYSKQSKSFKREKKRGNFSYGTKYDSTISPDKYSQTNTLFTTYQKNKFSINTSYKNAAFTPLNQQGKGTFSISPEYKINSHISVQSIYSTSFLDKNKKNEVVFSLTPFKDDRMNFDIGASQIYSENTAPTRSQLNFSTKFKF